MARLTETTKPSTRTFQLDLDEDEAFRLLAVLARQMSGAKCKVLPGVYDTLRTKFPTMKPLDDFDFTVGGATVGQGSPWELKFK